MKRSLVSLLTVIFALGILFAANSATVTALDAQNVTLSRAEVLFGQGTTITKDDWYAARDS